MKTFYKLLICLAIGLLLSIQDIAWPQESECTQLFRVVGVTQDIDDQDDNRVIHIWVTRFMQDNGTDGMCKLFGECILALLETQPSMAAIQIMNPESEWVPSMWRYIEVHRAMVLAGDLDLEEYAVSMGYHYIERED